MEKKVLSVEEVAKLLHKTQWGYFNSFLNMPDTYSRNWDNLPSNFKNLYIHQATEMLVAIADGYSGMEEYIILKPDTKRMDKIISEEE